MTDACTEHLRDNEQPPPLRLAVLGPAGAGKDTAAAWLREHTDLRGDLSTSEYYWDQVAGIPLSTLPKMKATTEGRTNLAQRIDAFNWSDGSGCLLYRRMAECGYSLFTGIRRLVELRSAVAHGIVTHALWIERPGCEDGTLDFGYCEVQGLFGEKQFAVANEWDIDDLHEQVSFAAWRLGIKADWEELTEKGGE